MSLEFNTTISEREGFSCAETSTHDRVVVNTGSGSVSLASVVGVGGAKISRSATPVGPVTACKSSGTYVVLGVRRLEVQDTLFNKRCGSVVNISLEFPVSSSVKSEFVLPRSVVESVEVILKDKSLYSHGT